MLTRAKLLITLGPVYNEFGYYEHLAVVIRFYFSGKNSFN